MSKASLRQIGAAMMVTSAGTLVSRFTGMARDILFAGFWGTGDPLAAFFEISESLADEVLSIPIRPDLEDREVEQVIDAITVGGKT